MITNDTAQCAVESHFARDCMWIVEQLAQRGPDALPGIAALVLLSIQQPFSQMPRQMASVAKEGIASPYLFGSKAEGLAYVQEHKRHLFRVVQACRAGKLSLEGLITEFLAIPGLGIAKTSFLAQMSVGDGACLDVLNLRRLGLNESAFKIGKGLGAPFVARRIQAYNAVWQSQGDSAYWWDTWCDGLAARQTIDTGRKRKDGTTIMRRIAGFADGAEVSALHRIAITEGVR